MEKERTDMLMNCNIAQLPKKRICSWQRQFHTNLLP